MLRLLATLLAFSLRHSFLTVDPFSIFCNLDKLRITQIINF